MAHDVATPSRSSQVYVIQFIRTGFSPEFPERIYRITDGRIVSSSLLGYPSNKISR